MEPFTRHVFLRELGEFALQIAGIAGVVLAVLAALRVGTWLESFSAVDRLLIIMAGALVAFAAFSARKRS